MFNSFLGSPTVVKAFLESRKAEFIANRFQRLFLKIFGSLIIRICGWPLTINERHQARIFRRFLTGQTGRLLDMGGSYGSYAFHFARGGWDVTVIDIDDDSLRVGRAIKEHLGKPAISFLHRDLLQTGFEEGEFDVVLLSQVLEHIKDDAAVLREAGRVLRPGGILVIAVPHSAEDLEFSHQVFYCDIKEEEQAKASGAWAEDGHWRQGYSFDKLQALLEMAGFTIEDKAPVAYSLLVPSVVLMPKSIYAFPVTFPLSLLPFQIKSRVYDVVVKARRGL